MQIILASQSPRRQELLARLGIPFDIQIADIDESMSPAADPAHEVRRVAGLKAAAIAKTAPEDAVVIAADTIVVCGGKILGKPHSEASARAMLQSLSGGEHTVLTGLIVRCGAQIQADTVKTRVLFRTLSDCEISAYIATGDSMDKAGAYGVQGLGAVFVRALDGDYYNVMGLPMCRLCEMLRAVGVCILGTTG